MPNIRIQEVLRHLGTNHRTAIEAEFKAKDDAIEAAHTALRMFLALDKSFTSGPLTCVEEIAKEGKGSAIARAVVAARKALAAREG